MQKLQNIRRFSGRYLLCLILLGAASVSQATEEWQFWLDVDAGKIINDHVSLHAKQSMRWTEDLSHFSRTYTDVGVRYKTLSWLTTGLFFRAQYSDTPDDGWESESRPYGDATMTYKTHWVQFSGRHRLEYRIRDQSDDVFRYRFKLSELATTELTRLKLRPYMAQEIFVNEGDELFDSNNRMRYFIGVRGDPVDRYHFLGLRPSGDLEYKSDIYLMVETEDHDGGWDDSVVIGFKWGVLF